MFSLKDEKKEIRLALLIAEIIFITLSLISVLKYGNSLLMGSLQKFENDDVKYIRSAWNLIDNKMLCYKDIKQPTVYIMPGLTFVLSFFMIIFGKFGGITAFRVFQVMLQAGSIYLIFLIGRKVFESKTAIIACIIDALYGAELFASNTILMECMFKFLFLLLVYISIYAVETKSSRLYAAGGVVWGLSCLLRPTIAAYPIVILIMWIKNKYKLSEIIKYTALVSGIFCLIMMPWWVRNYKTFNKFILFTKSSGNPFIQGTFVNYNKPKGWEKLYQDANELQSDQNEINGGLERLKTLGKQQPLKYILWYTVGKTFYFWRRPFYWKTILNIPYYMVQGMHIVILLLGILGIMKSVKKNINAAFLLSIIIYFNLIYLPFYTFERYSFPLMSLVIIFAAFILNHISKLSGKYAL